jgi:putative glycosyltransferase
MIPGKILVGWIGLAMRLSIVTTLYMSEPYVLEFYRRARAAANEITPDFEMIFVDDGSPDGSLDQAVSLLNYDPCVRVIQLSRNFGHHKAIMTGLAHATGDLVFLIDSDLEEDPALLEPFYEKLVTTGADVVFGLQARRPGGWWKNLGPKMTYRAWALLCNPPVHENVLSVRLMRADYVRCLVQHQERELSLASLWQFIGFYQLPMFVNKASKGTTTYTFAHKVAAAVNNITSFSNKPLVFVFYLGAAIFIISSLAAGYLIIDQMFFRVLLAGWASVIISIWMLGGLTIFCLGLIGIYISKIFIETKQRPYTIIRRTYGPNLTPHESASLEATFHVARPVNGECSKEDLDRLPSGDRRL